MPGTSGVPVEREASLTRLHANRGNATGAYAALDVAAAGGSPALTFARLFSLTVEHTLCKAAMRVRFLQQAPTSPLRSHYEANEK